MGCRNLISLFSVSFTVTGIEKYKCVQKVYVLLPGSQGECSRITKKTTEVHIYTQKNRISPFLPVPSHLPQGWSFFTAYSFPCIAPGGPGSFKSSENKSHHSLCREAALRSGRFNGAYVQLFCTAPPACAHAHYDGFQLASPIRPISVLCTQNLSQRFRSWRN